MPISTCPSNKESHPGYADLPEKQTRDEPEQSLGQSEVNEHGTDPLQPRKPPKHQKIVAKHKKELIHLPNYKTRLPRLC